jgi:hypothetical protein
MFKKNPASEACISLTNVLKALLFIFSFFSMTENSRLMLNAPMLRTLFLIVLLGKLQLHKYN